MRNDTKLRAAAVATSIALAFPGGVAIAEEAATTTPTNAESTAQVTDAEQNAQVVDSGQAAQIADAEPGAKTDGATDVAVTGPTDEAVKSDETNVNANAASENTDLVAQATASEMASEGWKEAAPKEDVTWKDVDGYRLYYREDLDTPSSWAKLSDDGVPMTPGIKVIMDAVDLGDCRLIANGGPMVQRVLNYSDINPDELIPSQYNKEDSKYKMFWYGNGWYTLKEDGRLYQLLNGDPGAPSGVSAGSDTSSDPVQVAVATNYESGTSVLTPATGTAYVSPTASVATADVNSETSTAAIPATSDSTSLVGVIFAIVAAVGAFIGAKVLRNRG